MAPTGKRVLKLLSLLQTGRRWQAEDLATAMDLNPRTLRRDINALRELGYPIDGVRGPGGYYLLNPGKVMPPIMLDDDEAIAAALGLRLVAEGQSGVRFPVGAAQRADQKLRRLLPAALREKTEKLLNAIVIGNLDPPQSTPAQLTTVASAVTEHKTLDFDYEGPSGRSKRTVEPARLIHLSHRWYLYCWDLDRENWRTFRLDRIVGELRVGLGFTPRALPAEDLARHLQEQFRGPAAKRIVLDLEASVHRASTHLHRVDGTLEPLEGGGCRYTAFVDSYQWLALVLAVSPIDFKVVEPTEFREYIHAIADRFGRS